MNVPISGGVSVRRRRLLQAGAVSVIAAPFAGVSVISSQAKAEGLFFSAAADNADNYFCAAFNENGELRFRLPIDVRAHSAAWHGQSKKVVLFSRRPGNKAYLIDVKESRIVAKIKSEPGRHFYGHGVFSADGGLLYTTENDFENGVGVISVRDGNTLDVIDEFPAYGIGPHELKMMPDGKTLVVALGGILTHPDKPREKLNIDSMSPSLNYINSLTGELLGQYWLSDHQLSIRHLDVFEDSTVALSMQYEGSEDKIRPLLGFHHRGEEIKLARASEELYQSLNHYTGAVCCDSRTGLTAVSCPRGGVVTFWNSYKAEYIDSLRIRDSGGITLSRNKKQFIISSGNGSIYRVDARTLEVADSSRIVGARWDNHLINIA